MLGDNGLEKKACCRLCIINFQKMNASSSYAIRSSLEKKAKSSESERLEMTIMANSRMSAMKGAGGTEIDKINKPSSRMRLMRSISF